MIAWVPRFGVGMMVSFSKNLIAHVLGSFLPPTLKKIWVRVFWGYPFVSESIFLILLLREGDMRQIKCTQTMKRLTPPIWSAYRRRKNWKRFRHDMKKEKSWPGAHLCVILDGDDDIIWILLLTERDTFLVWWICLKKDGNGPCISIFAS